MEIRFNTHNVESYRQFLAVKSVPSYRITGHRAWVPDEYATRIGAAAVPGAPPQYVPHPSCFDYQADITRIAIEKRKYAAFIDCGYGKTLVFLEYARHVASQLPAGQCVLIVSPLMVIDQTLAECRRFYGDALSIERVEASGLQKWLSSGTSRIGITNYEAIHDGLNRGRLGCLILDESGMLKSHYGKWGSRLIAMGRGLLWKLCLTGTPAPNDRIEYANHAVFLDQFPTVNAFLARYFVNRGQTQERWVLKPHALRPFYRSLSHWCIFLTNPATYGWKDNAANIPPIHVHIHDVPLTDEQERLAYKQSGRLFASDLGGITSRAAMGGIAKGWHKNRRVATEKPAFIRNLVASWPEESTIIWCLYNEEQSILEGVLPDAASIKGATPHERRMELIDAFKAGKIKQLISKPKVLGYGLNLQIATRQVFSGLQDSYESFYQAVKRSNRIGSMRPLNVHIPVTEIERPMIETVLTKARRVQADAEEQERIFRDATAI